MLFRVLKRTVHIVLKHVDLEASRAARLQINLVYVKEGKKRMTKYFHKILDQIGRKKAIKCKTLSITTYIQGNPELGY